MPAGSDNEVYWRLDENLFRWGESLCHVPHLVLANMKWSMILFTEYTAMAEE